MINPAHPDARFVHVEARAGLYRAQAEIDSLMLEHHLATICFDVADAVGLGVHVYESINSLDNDWRLLVLRNEVEFSPALETRIEHLYRSWLQVSQGLLRTYEAIRAEYLERGFSVDAVATLQKATREIASAGMPDENFFVGDALVSLRDEAIDAFREGRFESTDLPQE